MLTKHFSQNKLFLSFLLTLFSASLIFACSTEEEEPETTTTTSTQYTLHVVHAAYRTRTYY